MKKTVSFNDIPTIKVFDNLLVESENKTKMEQLIINSKSTDIENLFIKQYHNKILNLSNISLCFENYIKKKKKIQDYNYFNNIYNIEFKSKNFNKDIINIQKNDISFKLSSNNLKYIINPFSWNISNIKEWEIKIFETIITENEKKNKNKQLITFFNLDMQHIMEDYLTDTKNYNFYDIFTGIIFCFNIEN